MRLKDHLTLHNRLAAVEVFGREHVQEKIAERQSAAQAKAEAASEAAPAWLPHVAKRSRLEALRRLR